MMTGGGGVLGCAAPTQVMVGICRGAWIVSPAFVMQSLAAGALVDPHPYELVTVFPGARMSRCAREALQAAHPAPRRRYKYQVLEELPRVCVHLCVLSQRGVALQSHPPMHPAVHV